MELAHRGDLAAFVLASSDRDFAPLARWMVEKGIYVLGLGGATAPLDWQKSCSRFEMLKDSSSQPSREATPFGALPANSIMVGAATPKAVGDALVTADLSETDEIIRAIIQAQGMQGTIGIGALGAEMGSRRKVTLDGLGVATWRAYLAARPHLYMLDAKAPNARVRWVGP